jgi:hypothetical protein
VTQQSDGADAVEADLDAAPPAGTPEHSRPARDRRRQVLIVTLAVGVAVAAAVVVQQTESQRGRVPLDGSVTADELFPVLTEPPAPGTMLPSATMGPDIGISPGTERRLATTSRATFWVARAPFDGVCLLVVNADQQLGYGGVCTPAAAAAAHGVELPAGGGPSAVLVPARFDTAALARTGYTEVAPGLWVDG